MIVNPKISILVPIYNVEQFLQRCIDSVLVQDFADWELVLVDDGSPDSCPYICDTSASKDKRIKVVHKQNGGLPSARLAGFREAKGEYLVFLDADDYLLPNALTLLYIEISKGYDIVRSLVMREDNEGKQWIEHYPDSEKILEGKYCYSKALAGGATPYLHCAIYKASLFDENAFLKNIDNGITVGEDWITNFLISHKVMKHGFCNAPTCVYCLNTESMINTSIRAWDYAARVSKATADEWEILPSEIRKYSRNRGIVDNMKYFFLPEIPFNWDKYRELRPLLEDALKSEEGKSVAKASYLRFHQNPILFYLYSRLYCFAYKYINLKGKTRRELK